MSFVPRSGSTPSRDPASSPRGHDWRAAASALAAAFFVAVPSAAAQTPTPSPTPSQTAAGTDAAAKRPDIPFGIPVPGKPGYVYSPYAPDSGMVDLHGFHLGQEVRCPYTSKIFLVPLLP